MFLDLLATRDHDGHRAAVDDVFETLAVVGLDEVGAVFGGDPAGEAEVPCVSAHLLSDGGDCQDGDPKPLSVITEPGEISEGTPFVIGSHEDGNGDGGRVEPNRLLDGNGALGAGES